MTIKKLKSQILKSNKIDKLVYTRWINYKLRSIKKVVADFQHDLSDGVMLTDLIELLSLKKLENIKLPTDDRRNKISNISNILSFLQTEGISLKAIDSIDIIDGSLQKITELIWAVIFHYSIKKCILDNVSIESSNDFLKWITSKLDGYQIDNFTSSWSNGIAIGVLVNTCDKDICTDVLHWHVDNTLNNANFAMEAALQCLNVPLLLKPLEITSGKVSERAVMIYLSQFIYLLQNVNINKINGTVKLHSSVVEDAGNTTMMFAALPVDNSLQIVDSVYGVRIKEQEPLYVNTHIHILVTIPRDQIQSTRNLIVEAVNPNGTVFPCTQTADYTKSDEVQFTFVPSKLETYEVVVRNNENNILNNSFKMNILPRSKSNEIIVYGPGLSFAMSNRPGVFIIETKGINQQIGFSMEGPSKTIIQCIDLGEAIIKISYLTFAPGVYQLSIISNEIAICGSPYRVNVTDFVDTQEIEKVRVTGIQDRDVSAFIIDARNSGFTTLPDVQCYDKFGTDLQNILIQELDPQRFQIDVSFRNVDRYILFAGFDHIQIEGFPYKINQNVQDDDAKDSDKTTVSSSFHEQCLTILNQGLVDAIELSIQDLCVDTLKDIEISNKFETKANLCLSESLTSAVNSAKKNDPVADFDSFKWVDEKFGINLYGMSLNGLPVKTCESQIITVDLKKSLLDGELGIALEGPSDTEVKCFDNGDGICIIKYQPTKHGQYELIINFNEQPIGGSPFTIFVADNLDKIPSPCNNASVTCKVKRSSPNVTEKLENTLNTCDNGSISSFNMDSIVQNTVKSKLGDDQAISVDQTSPELIDSNEINSMIGSSSNTSGHSIMSGVYKAKIKKLTITQTLPFVQSFNSAVDKSDKSVSSQSLSTSMEIEKISQNYNELLLSFYGNMISAFTNLAVIEIVLVSIEKLVDLIVSKTERLDNTSATKYKRKRVDKLSKKNHQNGDNNLSEVYSFYITNPNQIPSKPLNDNPRSAVKVSSVKSSRLSRKINSFNETIDLFVNNSIRRVSSLNRIHFPPTGAISSFEIRDNKDKIVDNTSSVSEYNNTYVTDFDQNNKRTFYSPSDALTFTKHSLMAFEECYKSVGVDVASSSISSNQLRMRESCVQGTDAEVVFDSSFVESNQMSSYISVFDKGIINDEILKSDFSIDFEGYSKAIDSCKNYFDDYRETKSRDRASTSNFSKINSFKDCMSETIKESNSSMVNRQNLITGLYNTDDDGVVSCHYFEIPLTLRSHAKRTKKHEWKKERQCKTVDKSLSTLNYITEVIQSSLINPGYNTVEQTLYSRSEFENASTLSELQDNRLVPINGLSIDDEVQSLMVTRSLENELQVNIGIEHCKVRNITGVSMSLPIFHQLRCRDKRWNMKHKTVGANANKIILMETVRFCTSQMHQCLKSDSHRYELYKKEEKTVEERSAQTSMFVQEPKPAGEGPSVTIPSFDRSQNKSPPNAPYLTCSNNYQVSSENYKMCHNERTKCLHNCTPIQEASSNESQDISSAVETLVDAITDIAKNHLILHPSKGNIKRVEELVQLLPRLLKFGKEKRLYQINYLTDKLESILLQNHDQNSKKALGQIIQCIKHCVSIDMSSLKEKPQTDCDLKTKINRKSNIRGDKDILEDIVDDARKVKQSNPDEPEVHVIGQALHEGVLNEYNKFVVHTNARTPGSLSICFEGPSKAEITFVDQKIGIYIVSYKVTLPGEYFCSIQFNQHHIFQSPFKIIIKQNKPTNLGLNETAKSRSNNQFQLESKTKHPIMLPVGRNIMFHIRSLSISNLTCFVTEPTGACMYIPIEQISSTNRDGVLNLFTARVGMYTLDFYNSTGDKIENSWTLNITNDRGSLKASTIHCNMEINEPNKRSVTKLTEMHHNICAYGEGLEQARVNQKTFFYIFIRNHSENLIVEDPSLDVTIDGPSKVNISCVEDTNGYTFCYIPVIPGIYFIGIRFTGQFHLQGSPFKVIVLS